MTNEQLSHMKSLVQRLNAAADAYYNGQAELMTDYEWNALFDELTALEAETGIALPDSPTQNVSADNLAGQKEEHEFAALSLAKTKQPAELAKWAEGRPIWLSWKLDGLTLVATYDAGRLSKVVTRGNGHIGTNITHLAPAINGIPPRIKAQGHVVVRGEAVISYADFEQFNMESDEEYANPRNLASGSLTLKDINEVRQRHIHWIPFTLVHTDEDLPTMGRRMEWLSQQGFEPVERELIVEPTLSNIEQVIDRWTEKVTTGACPYPVDGLVISYDDTEYAQTGSVTGHHATRAGYAFKWQDEQAESTLDHIEWSCAASTIAPVAVFAPVELEGTTVKRASLCNISECERLGIGDHGTRLAVIKSNKIIPKVVRVIERVGQLEIPCECPVCKAPTEVVVKGVSNTKTLHCTNAHCPAKQLRKFARFVSKEGLNIDGISEATLARFINLGWVSEYADLYQLQEHIQQIALLDGFGQRSATNIIKSIEQSRRVDAVRLLYALSIPLCGQDVCKRLLADYPFAELIEQAETTDDTAFFSHIDHIGPEKSASFISWFREEENRQHVTHLLEQLTVEQASANPRGNVCEGLTFVITGDVHHYKNRNELKAYIESQGGKVTGSVSRSTSFLINNDITSASGKNQKAQQLGIPILSEDDFIARFANETNENHETNKAVELKKVVTPVEGNLFG